MNGSDDSGRHARRASVTALFWFAAFALGFASCSAVTLRTSWGDSVWPGPLIGALVTQVVVSVVLRRRPSSTARQLSWGDRLEWVLRFILMTILIAGANFAVGAVALGAGFHD